MNRRSSIPPGDDTSPDGLPDPYSPRPVITIVIDAGELPGQPPDLRIRDVLALESGYVVVGDHNRIDHRAKFRVSKVEVTSEEFWDRIPDKAKHALSDLRLDPMNSAANKRFRQALPKTELVVKSSRTDLMAAPGTSIDLKGNTGQLAHGNHNRMRSTSTHTIAKGQLPLDDLLRDNHRLVKAFAESFDNPDKREPFTRELSKAVKSRDITDITPVGKSDIPFFRATGQSLTTSGASVLSLGTDNDISSTTSTSVGRVMDYLDDQIDDIGRSLPPLPLPDEPLPDEPPLDQPDSHPLPPYLRQPDPHPPARPRGPSDGFGVF